jgi:CMP-N-acetylneuraminic acid synthetase
MVNPVSPLVLPEDIDDVIRFFEEGDYDSVISVKEEKLQSFYGGDPLNLDIRKKLPMTQDLSPIQLCCWTVCVWNAKKLHAHFEKNGFGVFVGKLGLYSFDHIRALKVSTETDFRIAEVVIEARNRKEVAPSYYMEGEPRS